MMTNRRHFLKLLGIAAPSAPLAAKAAFDAEAAALTSLRGYAAAPIAGDPRHHLDEDLRASMVRANNQAAKYVKMFGKLPDFIERRIINNAQHVRSLDPDIAAKRSWSLAVKIMTQRERNIAHDRAEHEAHDWYYQAQQAFAKQFGFEWPW